MRLSFRQRSILPTAAAPAVDTFKKAPKARAAVEQLTLDLQE